MWPTSTFDEVAALQRQVRSFGACSLPGVSIVYDRFMDIMWRAVSRGYVSRQHADFVAKGLWHGFDCGIDVKKLRGKRRYLNYKSALEARSQVTKATKVRVSQRKTLLLCKIPEAYRVDNLTCIPFDDYRIFPLGAVPKPLEPSEVRPVSDHTKSGVKAATDDDGLKHSLTALNDIEREFKFAYSMIVGDVDAAYPILPLAWWLWPFFMFVWFDITLDDLTARWRLYMHLTGDFGTSGLPGTFKIFFSDVVVNMARSELLLTLPLPVYVDDCSLIGDDQSLLNSEWQAFKAFLKSLGITMKDLKERSAAMVQLVLGFWWDSIQRTRTLESRKLEAYKTMFAAFAQRRALSLTETQQVAGRMQRAVMTLPPGASCMLASMYAMMAGLTLGFQKRRLSNAARMDLQLCHDLLSANMGRGYFSYDQFARAPAVWTDASKSQAYAGGGYVSACGAYRFWSYGRSAARKPIDFLEGDAVVLAVEDLGPGWHRCVVPIYLDNTAFERSAVKGWSHAARLQLLLRKLFFLALKFECVFEFHWLSTHANVHADALSRPPPHGEGYFLSRVYADAIWKVGPCWRHPLSGGLRCLGKEYSNDVAGDGPPRRGPTMVNAVSFPRCSVFEGLPTALHDVVDELMDNRHSASSQRTVKGALVHWDNARAAHGWPRVIPTDDPCRGGKLATFVSFMVLQTDLVYSSIKTYVWGLRVWVKSQRHVDPVLGVFDWDDFMLGVHVKAWQPSEPRKAIPLALLRRAIMAADVNSFQDVQMVLLILILLFTFARSETPCPTTLGGFDDTQHMSVKDFTVRPFGGVNTAQVRLKRIKQDQRLERPQAAGNQDWSCIGDVVGDPQFSIMVWFARLCHHHDGARDPDSPFFIHSISQREVPLTYGAALRGLRELLGRVTSAAEAETYGLHGLRVAGWNGARRGPAGEELAVAQGGWRSDACYRYDRFGADEVRALPTHILTGADEALSLEHRQAPSSVPVRTSAFAPPPATTVAPAGWHKVTRTSASRAYRVWVGPPGSRVCYSIPEIHRYLSRSQVASPARKRARVAAAAPAAEAAAVARHPHPQGDASIPFEDRCSNWCSGCSVVSVHGSHRGICDHLVLSGSRRRNDGRRGRGVRGAHSGATT